MAKRREVTLTLGLVVLVLLVTFQSSNSGVVGRFEAALNYPAAKIQSSNTHTARPVTSRPEPDTASAALAAALGARTISGVVVRRLINPYQRQVLLNVGSQKGVARGQLVVADGYLVGRVSGLSTTQSWVQLVSDPTFRIGLTISSTAAEVILKGGGTAIFVDRVPSAEDVSGRQAVTYGDADSLDLANIPVGQIGSEVTKTDYSGLKKYLLDRPLREEFVGRVMVLQPGVAP